MAAVVCSEPEAIAGPWLTEALEGAGVARGAEVTDVEFLGCIGTGQTGRNARFALTWDEPEGRPATIVGKFPSADPNARQNAFANGNYRKEWLFYDRVAPTVGIRTPQCYVARYDTAAPDFVLLMEDLCDSCQGDQLDGLTPDQIALAVEQAVALHAPRFGDPTLETFLNDGLPELSAEQVGMMAQMLYGATLPGFLERLEDRLDPDIAQLAKDFAPHVARWTQGTDTPATVIHLDYRADNLLFGTTPDAAPLVVVDWQTLGAGLGHSDIAYLISGSFSDAADRAAQEGDLVEDYRARMAAEGIEQSVDDCWRDYRFGSLWGMVITVIATVAAEQTERGDDMLTAMAQRHGRQALDLDALALLA
ncbi:MAG: phosphotransferase [Actinomycetota bacterium]|nr:phosphotransferase [Actinomycetota bacterium]